MPLPAALQARLAKRGIVKVEEPKPAPAPVQSKEEVEEVFAEDYDDPSSEPVKPPPEKEAKIFAKEEENKENVPDELVFEAPGCPNRSNKYHTCSDYCMKRWGLKKFEADEASEKKRERMLRKYPLPDGWKEVGDPNTGRHYYWNMITDQVSWLAPTHPKAIITISSEKLAEALTGLSENGNVPGPIEVSRQEEPMEEEEEHDFEEIEKEVLQEKRKRERERERERDRDSGRTRDRKGRQIEALDPMDPAAYSDIPRGTWSTGLERQGTAKTGADTTASGPLFQQRPYPSPGAVLRANKAAQPPESDESGED